MDYQVVPGAAPISANAPIYIPTANELAIMAYGPSLWLDLQREFIRSDSAGVMSWAACRATGRRFMPGPAGRPAIVSAGSGSALDFTPGAAATRALFAEDGAETLLGGNTYTTAALVNVISGAIIGAADTSGQYPLLFADQSDASRISWWANLGTGGRYTSGQSATNAWRILLSSSSPTEYRIEVDGFGLTFAQSAGAIVMRKAIIGATGDGSVFPLAGKIASAIHVPGLTAHAKPEVYNAIIGHLNAIRFKLNA